MKTLATTYGGGVEDWSKVAWGISTESAGYRPDVRVGIAFQQQLQEQYPAMRGGKYTTLPVVLYATHEEATQYRWMSVSLIL